MRAKSSTIKARNQWLSPESIVAKWGETGDERSYRLYLDDGVPKLDLSSDGSTVYTLNDGGTDAIAADEWTHVAATRDGSWNLKLLVTTQGEPEELASATWSNSLNVSTAAVRIGADDEGSYFAGMIDEVRVMGVDRSATLGQAEVNYRYNARNQLTLEYAGAYVPESTAPPADVSVRTYSYDKNGNVKTIVETVGVMEVSREEMDYDELNRMLSHAGPAGTESFSYRGAEWHRYSANGKTFLYDGDNVAADVGTGGSVDAFYVTPFLDQNLSITSGATPATYYYSQDGLGSVRTLTDSFGTLKNKYDYDAFGKPFAPGTSVTVQQRYTYTGREQNPTSALMYYRYRQYDERVGRFVTRDRLLRSISRGESAYAYAGARPTFAPDPFGLDWVVSYARGFVHSMGGPNTRAEVQRNGDVKMYPPWGNGGWYLVKRENYAHVERTPTPPPPPVPPPPSEPSPPEAPPPSEEAGAEEPAPPTRQGAVLSQEAYEDLGLAAKILETIKWTPMFGGNLRAFWSCERACENAYPASSTGPQLACKCCCKDVYRQGHANLLETAGQVHGIDWNAETARCIKEAAAAN